MPFCSNCGKEHSSDAKFCTNCGRPIISHNSNNQQYHYSEQYHANHQPTPLGQEQVSGVYGLGKAIAGAILGTIAITVAIIALMCLSSAEIVTYDAPHVGIDYGFTVASIIFSLISTALSILTIVFSSTSIRNFNYAKENLKRYPIPTLIIGIHFLIVGISSCLFATGALTSALSIL